LWEYIKNLFDNCILVAISAIWGVVSQFLFPDQALLAAAAAVLGIMGVDLLTKMFALSRQHGGLRAAIKGRHISSAKFAKGTMDKLIVFGVMLIVGGCAYQISPVASVATGFMQLVFALMFLRDVLSIIENLGDAGISGLGPFKKLVKKKYDEVCGDDSSSDNNEGGTKS
jgi:hypothetical protein